MDQIIERLRSLVQTGYKQQFGVGTPKYIKYIGIAFGGTSLLLLRYLFWKVFNKFRSYPPGPVGLPLLGSMIPFGSTPFKFMINTAQTYGPITYVSLLASRNIFISDPKVLLQLFKTQKIIKRAPIHFREDKTMLEVNGHAWDERRKFVASTVISITKSSFILSHVKECIDKYVIPKMNERMKKNELWFPAEDIQGIAFNIVLSAIFDHVLPFDDPFIQKYSQSGEKIISRLEQTSLIDLITNFRDNFITRFLKRRIAWNEWDRFDDLIINWMNQNGFVIDKEKNIMQRETDDNITNKNVYVDFLMTKLNDTDLNVKVMLADIQAMLAGGIGTTTQASQYGFLLLAKYPEIQEMIYKELQNIMEKNNLLEFNFSIINQLHVFRAFIYEVLRISTVAPIGSPHITDKDHMIEVDGKKMIIPKYTICHQNSYFMNKYLDWNDNNKILREENNEIHLEYWLTKEKDGKFKMNDNFTLFGVGKRDCPGRSIAIKGMYATFGLMMNNYKFKAENNDPNGINIKQAWGPNLNIQPPIGIKVELR